MKTVVFALLAIVALAAATVVFGAVMYSLEPTYPIERCLDHGARWNYSLGKCECTPEELSSPAVTKEMIAHCNTPSPAPER